MPNNENFKVASYIRLSREDGDKQESESIGNQRNIINRYIQENNLRLVDEYVDDGVSGTTFDRPGFNRLIEDIESGKINMIITKDFSRLGREYIQLGHYMEVYFPEHNIRYVALNDGIDTFTSGSWSELTPFRAIINDSYAKDISKKVRSVLKEKQKKGEYMCTVPPYGYKKDIARKNHLVIDENVAYIVRKIFSMYLEGNSIYAIKEYLNGQGIQSPSGYAKNLLEIKKWNTVTLQKMLGNKAYIGHTVANKRVKLSYKTKKRVAVSEDQYIITENTHEAIVTQEDFDKVQFLLNQKSINRQTKHEYCLRGLMKCKTCHSRLEVGAKLTKNGKQVKNPIPYVTCRNSKKGLCPAQHLNYNKLEREVLEYLRGFLKVYGDKDKLAEVYQIYQESKSPNHAKQKKELAEIETQINALTNQVDILYSDRLNGIISQEDFMRYSQSIKAKKEIFENRKEEIEKMLSNSKGSNKSKEKIQIDKVIEEFLKMEKPNKKILFQLIDEIEIDENKNVYIKFAFKELERLNRTMLYNKEKE